MSQQHAEQARWFAQELLPHEGKLRAWLGRRFALESEMDDVIQDSYVKVLAAHDRGELQHPKAFLFSVARNTVLDLMRRRKVSQVVSYSEIVRSAVLDERPGVVDLVSLQQELGLLRQAIDSLPERCAQVFVLRKIQGLSQKEIAAQLDISENTVETLVAKGARRCHEFMHRHGLADGGKRST
jgi:RNA polymerase sigma factor (sigma-70 family)